MAQDPRNLQEFIAQLIASIDTKDYVAALSSARKIYDILVILEHQANFETPLVQPEDGPSDNALTELGIETIKDIVAQIDPEAEHIDSILDNQAHSESAASQGDDFESLTKDHRNLPEFDPVSTNLSYDSKSKPLSLNETLRPGRISLDLNDRLAFMKHLFEGKSGEFERIFEMLEAMESHKEAVDFIQSKVKPDYNNWEGKTEYEQRLMDLIANKFGQ